MSVTKPGSSRSSKELRVASANHSKESVSVQSDDNVDARFPRIRTMEDVITNFFNQIVQYVIVDMVVLEPPEEVLSKSGSQEVVKDYRDLQADDLLDADITAASGSKVTLSKKSSSRSVKKHKNGPSHLAVITEEPAEGSASKSSTATSSLLDPLMEEERQVKITFTNGNIYEGSIAKRIMNGKGRYLWSNGTTYEGDFLDGFPTGKGRMVLPDLSYYDGGFNQGLYNGSGFLNIVSTPTFYSGEWRNGFKHGQGWLLYEPGDWYEGGWALGLKDGYGVRYYKNGAKYRGLWRLGKYDGDGTMIWENNDYYRGGWSDGKMHGEGEYIWRAFYNRTFAFPLQNIYRGLWEKGKRSGDGIMLFGDDTGIKLIGSWDQDFKHGEGMMICGNGRIIENSSLFQYDKPLQSQASTWSMSKSSHFYRVIDLPIFAAPELVDVGFYIDGVLAKLQGINFEKLKLLKTFEEKYVKYVLIKYMVQLKELYQDYATAAAKTKLSFEPVLIRLFLWQLYKDKEIWKCGISLVGTDQVLAEHPKCGLDTVHNPFEPIYFWQFLMSLVGVALTTSNLEEIDDSTTEGVSAVIVKKFFDEIIFAKPVDHQSTLLLNYLDLAPIKSVYALYTEIGEPHTARTFFKESCTRKGETPLLCHLELIFQKAEPKFGSNLVLLDQYVTFDQTTGNDINDGIKHNWTNLLDFRHLGPKNIVRCLAKACPLIMDEGLVININYPLTFLEFYETLLTCIFMVLELEMKKEQKILWQSMPAPLVATAANSKSKVGKVVEPKNKSGKEGKKSAGKKKKKK